MKHGMPGSEKPIRPAFRRGRHKKPFGFLIGFLLPGMLMLIMKEGRTSTSHGKNLAFGISLEIGN